MTPSRKPRRKARRSGPRRWGSRASPRSRPVVAAGRKQEQTKAPADIPACAVLLGLHAVMLDRDEWFVLAAVSRSTGSPFVWREAGEAERILLDQAAGGRFVAGHWSVRPGERRKVGELARPGSVSSVEKV